MFQIGCFFSKKFFKGYICISSVSWRCLEVGWKNHAGENDDVTSAANPPLLYRIFMLENANAFLRMQSRWNFAIQSAPFDSLRVKISFNWPPLLLGLVLKIYSDLTQVTPAVVRNPQNIQPPELKKGRNCYFVFQEDLMESRVQSFHVYVHWFDPV